MKLAASIALAVFLAMGGARMAAAQDFKPCSDADAFAELRGSLCNSLRVPLAPGTDNPATIDLFVRKFPAPMPAKGTVWLVSGGPGESGATFYPFLDRLRKSFPGFDLIVPDHRGTGFSTRVCPKEEAASSPGGFALVGAEWGTCFQSLNTTPDYARAFSVTNAAHDLASLIAAFRGPTPTYVYGVSYGTQLVLRMMTIADPDIDGVILDSLVPPQTAPQWDLSHRSVVADKVGREILRRCDADRRCRTKLGGSAEAALTALLKSVEADEKLRDQIPGKDLKLFLGSLLDIPSARVQIPDLIAELAQGRTDTLATEKAELENLGTMLGRYPQSPSSIPLVSIISSSENNARPDLTADQVAKEKESLLFATALPALLVSPAVPLYAHDATFGKEPTHLPRTLVLQGTLDPKTPFEGAERHVAMLKSAGPVTLLAAKDAPHFVLFTAPLCFEAAAQSFVRGGAVKAPSCSKPETEKSAP